MQIKKPWVRFPLYLLNTLSPEAAILLSIFLGIADKELHVRCKQQEIAGLMHVSLSTAIRLLNELQDSGFIIRREQERYGTLITLAPNLIPGGLPGDEKNRRGAFSPPPENSSFDIAEFEKLANRF